MKIRHAMILLLSSGLLFFSSCLKDDPAHPNTTFFYGHQDIPSIRYFMPQDLLEAIGENRLFFGENPPMFLSDSSYFYNQEGSPSDTIVFTFFDPCMGMTSLSFKEKTDDFLESSNTNKTYDFVKDTAIWNRFIADTIAPDFFSDSTLDPEVLRHAYIMGKDSCFTLYYYEIRNMAKRYYPMSAVILSGYLHTEYDMYPSAIDTIVQNDTTFIYDSIPVNRYIHNIKWGVETMKYFPKNNSDQTALDAELSAGTQPVPGHVITRSIDTLHIRPTR